MAIKVGCCGFPVAKSRYYKSLSLVEVNSTFYTLPKLSLLERWRKDTPETLEFTAKAHQNISHIHRLEPNPECLEAYDRMREICQTLRSRLLIQTPASLKPLEETLLAAERFFKRVRGDLTLLWETSGPEWWTDQTRKRLKRLLREYGVVHVTDPFLGEPAYTENVVYMRLHGLGARPYYYQYSDDELKILESKVKEKLGRGREVYVLFNNLSMFDDALRFHTYLEKGKLPTLTSAYGIESFHRVFERSKFPTTLGKLRRLLGWKLFDVELGKQSHVDAILERMPPESFRSLEELAEAAKKYIV